MTKVLVVEDDKAIIDVLRLYIENEGYSSIIAETGDDAISQFNANQDISVIILDLNLPGEIDGMDFLREVRKDSNVPIIIASARTADIDRIQGLMKGADDYVTKPFNPLEVMARIRSLLRRANNDVQNEEQEIIDLGAITVNKDSHEVKTLSGDTINLTALEFGILYLLASHPNRVFSSEEIFGKVWRTQSGGDTKTVMVHVSHLRDKIKEATGGDEVVQTVWGVGYKVETH